MKNLTDLAKTTGCSEANLQAALDTIGVSIKDCYETAEYMTDVIALAAGGLAIASPAPLAKKGKGSKLATEKKASAKSRLATTEQTVEATQMSQFNALANSLGINADIQSEGMAELILAYPALVDAMTAQKVSAGLSDAPTAYQWGQSGSDMTARMQAIKDEFYGSAGL